MAGRESSLSIVRLALYSCAGLDGYLLDYDGILGPMAAAGIAVVNNHRLLGHLAHHIHSADHLAEDGVLAVEERGLIQHYIEPGGRRVRFFRIAASTDRSLDVLGLVVELRLEPVADAARGARAVAHGTAG